ncbi:Uncharacterised protein [Streptococcus pneumoniae]|nr:Uncharacterised protein [Streptococcus pneumoniae]
MEMLAISPSTSFSSCVNCSFSTCSSTISASATSAGSSCSSTPPDNCSNLFIICFACSTETICTSLEFTRLSILRSNDTFTIVLFPVIPEIFSISSNNFTTLIVGGDMSTVSWKNSDIDVAANPIIWFIASCTALSSNSPSSFPSSTSPVPIIIKSAIDKATSC